MAVLVALLVLSAAPGLFSTVTVFTCLIRAHALRVPPEMLVRLPPSDAVEPAVADAPGDGGRFPINAVAVSSRMVPSQL